MEQQEHIQQLNKLKTYLSLFQFPEIMLSVHCGTMLASANLLKVLIALKDIPIKSLYRKCWLMKGTLCFFVIKCKQERILGMRSACNTKISNMHGIILIYLYSHAARCRAFIPFINSEWCKSRECGFEFKIALRKNLINQGSPAIIPILLEQFKVYEEYPFFNFFLLLFFIIYLFYIFWRWKTKYFYTRRYPSVYGFLCSTNGIVMNPPELLTTKWTSILDALKKLNLFATEKIPQAIVQAVAPVLVYNLLQYIFF